MNKEPLSKTNKYLKDLNAEEIGAVFEKAVINSTSIEGVHLTRELTSNVWIITDPHLGHEKVMKTCGRPENHSALIGENLKKIPEKDILICLGDVAFHEEAHYHELYIKPLKCKKWLVKGNHDKRSNSWYLRHGWDFVCNTFRDTLYGKKILFSHVPIARDSWYDYNIHGHFHNLPKQNWESKFKIIRTDRHRLLSVEREKYKPIKLQTFISRKEWI